MDIGERYQARRWIATLRDAFQPLMSCGSRELITTLGIADKGAAALGLS
jgi:hypothetical protein